MDYPQLIRIAPLFYSIGTLIFLHKVCASKFNRFAAMITLMTLIMSVPYYNFALQLRGYGLSIFLVSMLFYFILKFAENRQNMHLLFIVLVSFSLFYTIPLNLLILVSITIVIAFHLIMKWAKSKSLKVVLQDAYFKIVLSISLGVGVAFLLYLPNFNDVFHNKFVEQSRSILDFNYPVISVVILSFVSKQYILLVLAAVGFYLMKNRKHVMILVALFVLPFIISVALGLEAFERVYVNLVILYAIIIGVGISEVFIRIQQKKIIQYMTLIVLVFCSLTVFKFQEIRIKDYLAIEEVRGQGLYFNYYLEYFHPKKDIEAFLEKEPDYMGNILILDCEPYGFQKYLEKFDVKYTYISKVDEALIDANKTTYVVTSLPANLIGEVKKIYPNIKIEILNGERSYNYIVALKK